MDINQEAILKQQGHIQSLLKVCVCVHINPASMGRPRGHTHGPPTRISARQHIEDLILLIVANNPSLLLIKMVGPFEFLSADFV